jgi:hypothetical protein
MGLVHEAYENPFPVSIATDPGGNRPARCPDDFGSLPGLIRLPGSLILGRMSGIDLPVVGFLRAAQHKGEQMDRCGRW